MELEGKKILFLGSSVTYGSASGGVSFVEFAAEKCGFEFVKEAVSGTTLADTDEKSYVSRLKKHKDEKIDLLICQLSTNDAGRNIPIEKTEAAIRFVAEYSNEIFACPIAFYTNPYYESENYAKLVSLLKGLSKELKISILDFYGIRMTDEEHLLYMSDRIHPTLKGYAEWMTPKFIEFLSDFV